MLLQDGRATAELPVPSLPPPQHSLGRGRDGEPDHVGAKGLGLQFCFQGTSSSELVQDREAPRPPGGDLASFLPPTSWPLPCQEAQGGWG